MIPDTGVGQVAFSRDAIVGRENSAGVSSEMWVYVVVRRETITQAVGKIVHVPVRLVRRAPLKIPAPAKVTLEMFLQPTDVTATITSAADRQSVSS